MIFRKYLYLHHLAQKHGDDKRKAEKQNQIVDTCRAKQFFQKIHQRDQRHITAEDRSEK